MERLLLDTVFIQGLVNERDQHHQRAIALLPRVRAAEVWVTEAVLTEVADALSSSHRLGAVRFIRRCYDTANIHVVPVDTALLDRALALYEARADKTWGLTDCISFIVMEDLGLADAVTADRHFIQAGYRALMRDR